MIQQLDHDSVSLHMRAAPDIVYALISDVTRTPEFSPEIVDCRWIDGATGPVVGARFKGRNKMPNRPTFSNKPIVTAADPGRTFAFSRTEPLVAPSNGDTTSPQTMTERRSPSRTR